MFSLPFCCECALETLESIASSAHRTCLPVEPSCWTTRLGAHFIAQLRMRTQVTLCACECAREHYLPNGDCGGCGGCGCNCSDSASYNKPTTVETTSRSRRSTSGFELCFNQRTNNLRLAEIDCMCCNALTWSAHTYASAERGRLAPDQANQSYSIRCEPSCRLDRSPGKLSHAQEEIATEN